MKRNKETKQDLSRRDFIKITAVGVGATALTGVDATAAKAQDLVANWDKEADVVIVGYGLAGAAAAITAHDAGAKVLILEKMPKGKEGGNSRTSGNVIWLPTNKEDAAAYYKALCATQLEGPPLHLFDITEEMVNHFVEGLVENKPILEQLGFKLNPPSAAEYIELPGATTGTTNFSRSDLPPRGQLFHAFAKEVTTREIEVLSSTPARGLIQDPRTKEILGVKVESGGWDRHIKARKAVILACGGFEFNEAMISHYSRAPVWHMGTPANTGDGIRMAMEVGADLWHMNCMYPLFRLGFLTQDLGHEFANCPWGLSISGNSRLWVDKYGRRFIDESRPTRHGWGLDAVNYFDGAKLEYPLFGRICSVWDRPECLSTQVSSP